MAHGSCGKSSSEAFDHWIHSDEVVTIDEEGRNRGMNRELKPCPFCGGTDIQYSIKTTGGYERKYHASMFCNNCHCYGARILYKVPSDDRNYPRYLVEDDTKLQKKAMDAWNRRVKEGAEE